MNPRRSLRQYRESRGLTLDQMASSLGKKGRGYFSGIETGDVDAPIRLALRIQEWSGGAVPAESLVSAEDAQLLRRHAAATPAQPVAA